MSQHPRTNILLYNLGADRNCLPAPMILLPRLYLSWMTRQDSRSRRYLLSHKCSSSPSLLHHISLSLVSTSTGVLHLLTLEPLVIVPPRLGVCRSDSPKVRTFIQRHPHDAFDKTRGPRVPGPIVDECIDRNGNGSYNSSDRALHSQNENKSELGLR